MLQQTELKRKLKHILSDSDYLKTTFRNLAGFKKSCTPNFNRSKKYQDFGRYFDSICMNFTSGSSFSFVKFHWLRHSCKFPMCLNISHLKSKLRKKKKKEKERERTSFFTINSLSLSAIDLKGGFSTVYRQYVIPYLVCLNLLKFFVLRK